MEILGLIPARGGSKGIPRKNLAHVAGKPLLAWTVEAALASRRVTRTVVSTDSDEIAGVARSLGASVLVFGSPGNRRRNGRPRELAVDFFRELASYAASRGVCVCVEPLPPELGTDFVTSAAEAAALVDEVSSPGFGLHLDSGSLHLTGEDPLAAIRPGLRHFHASEVGFGPLGTTGVDHERCAEALRGAGYDGVVSIEVLALAGPNRERVLAAVDYARRIYG